MNFNSLSSQNTTSVEVNKKIESLKSKGVKDIIVISNESNENVIIWKEDGKEKALKIYNKKSNCIKRKKVQLSKKEKEYFNDCLNNYKSIQEIDNKNCNEQVHAFTEISIKGLVDGKTSFSHKFYSHCGTEEQKQKIKPFMNLYYGLL
tara:strand:- start:301 stop:744 length:444 start_codon:yes stop_codon:yes gene_type:complete